MDYNHSILGITLYWYTHQRVWDGFLCKTTFGLRFEYGFTRQQANTVYYTVSLFVGLPIPQSQVQNTFHLRHVCWSWNQNI